jgi:hypothetical protein
VKGRPAAKKPPAEKRAAAATKPVKTKAPGKTVRARASA